MVDHLFASGHVSLDEIGWTGRGDDAVWLSSNKRTKSFAQAFPEYSLVKVIDPGDYIGHDNLAGILSVVPCTRYEEWLAEVEVSDFFPVVGRARANASYRSSLVEAMCAHRPSMNMRATMDIGGWVRLEEMAASDDIISVATLFRELLATEHGWSEFAAYHDEANPRGQRWSTPVLVRANRCFKMPLPPFVNHLRHGCLFTPDTFWDEACHCLCHPT